MSRRTSRSALALLIVVLTAGLAACGGSASPSPAASTEASAPATSSEPAASSATGETVEINFWSWAPGIDTAVATFNSSQSAIKVKLDNTNAGNADTPPSTPPCPRALGSPTSSRSNSSISRRSSRGEIWRT